ncbi:MAG: 1-acyl-sn-glycerol-3-phosphate acyltransferase [Thermoanaerobaculia bacterium]
MRAIFVYLFVYCLKILSRIFFRVDMRWIGDVPPDPWHKPRVVALLNHTSLWEPIFVGGVPSSFIWRLARHGVLPAAEKTINRPIVGILFRFVAHQVIAISRLRDHTWYTVLQKIDPDSMVLILPEGRMKRANGLDSAGNPMTVRGGIFDVLDAIGDGRMIVAYSGGLHHVQIPGQTVPKLFRKVNINLELLDIKSYLDAHRSDDYEQFKRNIRMDLERRRDENCPPQE